MPRLVWQSREARRCRWAPELQRMRAAFAANGTRVAFVTPAFERLVAHTPSGHPVKDAQGQPVATQWNGPCGEGTGCEVLQGMALPRSFEALRAMLQAGGIVDVFHRAIVCTLSFAYCVCAYRVRYHQETGHK